MAVGPRPTGIVAVTTLVGSIRETVSSQAFATQIAPAPTAIALEPPPTTISSEGARRAGSMRETVPPDWATQTEPKPTATPLTLNVDGARSGIV
jgi:hypothetical protein